MPSKFLKDSLKPDEPTALEETKDGTTVDSTPNIDEEIPRNDIDTTEIVSGKSSQPTEITENVR